MEGFQNALGIFQSAAKEIKAYQGFLEQNHILANQIKTLEQFKNIPLIDKKNYLQKHILKDLFAGQRIAPMGYASSGSSGKPTFWFRGDAQEKTGGEIHEIIFHDIFKIKKDESTLVIVCFAMGVWVAGNYTLASCRNVARKGYNLTTITPGIEQEDILSILSSLAPNFTNVVLAGYPPFLMNIINEAKKRKIPLKNNLKILTAGDKFSENWRTDTLRLAGIRNAHSSLVGVYGCADAGILGHETPLSIFLRRKAEKNKKLSDELFGIYLDLPGFVQYHPEFVFFEEIHGELVFTANAAIPLIRYNIHDVGSAVPYQEIKNIVKKYNLEKEAAVHGLNVWKLPFLVLKGRTDVAVTFYALKIPPEHIRAGIGNTNIRKFLSGNFFAYNHTFNQSKDQKLYIQLELAQGMKPSRGITK